MKWMNLRALGAIAITSLVFISCGTTAHIEKDDSVNFNKYRTFAWIETNENGEKKLNDMMETKVRSAVTTELQKKGWREVKSNPDVILNYDVLVERSSREKREPVYSQPYTRLVYNPYTRRYMSIYYPSQFLGYESYEELIKEGTITISMIDSKTDKVIWQGWTTDQVNSKNLTSREIQKAVNSIFKKFDLAKS